MEVWEARLERAALLMVQPCRSAAFPASSSSVKCRSASALPAARIAAGNFRGCPFGASMRATPFCTPCDKWNNPHQSPVESLMITAPA